MTELHRQTFRSANLDWNSVFSTSEFSPVCLLHSTLPANKRICRCAVCQRYCGAVVGGSGPSCAVFSYCPGRQHPAALLPDHELLLHPAGPAVQRCLQLHSAGLQQRLQQLLQQDTDRRRRYDPLRCSNTAAYEIIDQRIIRFRVSL